MRKLLLLSMLAFFYIGNSTMAQSKLKAELTSTFQQLDLKIGQDRKGEIKDILIARYRKNKAFIQRKYRLSDKEYNAVAIKVYKAMKDVNPKNSKRMSQLHYRKGDEQTRLAMIIAREAFDQDNNPYPPQQYTPYSISGKDILSTTADVTTIGAAIGAAVGAVAGGAPGAAIGGAVGGFWGASAGLGYGIGEEIGEEITGNEINN